jgi:hypothetical protein
LKWGIYWVQYITNDPQLRVLIERDISEALQEAAEKIQNKLSESMNNAIYNKPQSRYYKRTFGMMKSIFAPKINYSGGTINIEVGLDISQMEQTLSVSSRTFNAHMNQWGTKSFKQDPYKWNGIDVREGLVSWWDTGTSNPSNLPSLPTTNYWKSVMGDRMDNPNPDYSKAWKIFEEELTKSLSKFGEITVIGIKGGM